MHTRPELEAEFPEPGWHGQYAARAKTRRRVLRRYRAEDRNAATPLERRRRHQIAQRASEEIRQTKVRTRHEHIKQRQWINQARGKA